MKTLALLLSAAILLTSWEAGATPLPRRDEVALPDEKHLVPELEAALEQAKTDAPATLSSLDVLLAKLPRQTPMRGLVQFFRAEMMVRTDSGDARAAIDESILLLPQYTAPLFVAARIEAFDDRPGQAVDLLLRAARIDRRILHSLDDYEAGNLLGRLNEVNDRLRVIALSERLLEAGWRNGSPATLSSMAFSVLQARLDSGDIKGAEAMVPRLTTPSLLARLLTEKKFAPLRASAEARAGPWLEKIWPIHLNETRRRWEAKRDLEPGRSYAYALALAGHDRTLVDTFGLRLREPIAKRDEPLIFIATSVASALANLGRREEAIAIFEQPLKTWPADDHVLALNLTSNRGRLRMANGDFAGGLADLDAAIAAAPKWGGQVNHGAIASMHLQRACALAALGRSAEDARSVEIVRAREAVDPTDTVRLFLCKDDLRAAREAALRALDNEETRSVMLALLRPSKEEPHASDYERLIAERYKRFRADPAVRARASRYAYIPGAPLNANAPPEVAAGGP